MALKRPAIDAELGKASPSFALPATDGGTYSLSDVAGKNGTVVVFICNHCPYVRAVVDRMVADAKTLMDEGIGFVAISSNDVRAFPEDSFDRMKAFADNHGFPFPIFTTKARRWRGHTVRCAPPISSASTETLSLNTAAGSTRAVVSSRGRAPSASWSTRCA